MVLSMERWCGKVAIVTGASAGIGAAIVEQLVDNGVIVAGLARRVERVQELSKKLANKKGKLYDVKCDITKEEDILNAFKWVKENLGPINILINNAGILQKTNLVGGNTEMWKKVFDTNVVGLCIATREAVNDMTANKIDGQIIHINSVLGHKVPNIPQANVYPASKHAVSALTETLRLELMELNSNIKITSVSPGPVDTEIFQDGFAIQKLIKKFLKAEDVADAVMYVLSTPPHVQIQELTVKPLHEPF